MPGPNTSCVVSLYGNAGNISTASPNFTIVDTVGAFQIPLVRRNGLSGYVEVIVTKVTRIEYQQTWPVPNASIPFEWPSSLVLAPRQENASFGLFGISPSVSYMPFGQQYLLQFETNATWPRPTFQVVVTLIDDPLVMKAPLAVPNDTLLLQRATGSLLSLRWQRLTYPPGVVYRYNAEISGPYNSIVVDPRSMTWSLVVVDVPLVDFYNLVPQSLYFVRVSATNNASVGPSTTAYPFWTTPPGPASPPLDLAVSRVTGGSMIVAWRPPLDTSGIAVESYLIKVYIESSLVSSTTTNASNTSLVISNLMASTLYTVSVGANTKFPAAWFTSISQSTVIGGTIPTAPLPPLLQQVTGGSFTLLIVPSDDNGGYGLTKYTLFISPGGKNNFTIACMASTPSCTVNRLTPTTTYDVFATTMNPVVGMRSKCQC
ncbi:hypothetical protein DYB32_004228 [Aphanomyces invadans]|uniref:Fibronectin type-III domain-containing protein n=1 Tax=Aphanomyces invadans TaxID=157072 RepID=A0A418AY56_9STRA|nr:hypothetical protein DYB32_004228 [Aphanomyces invadans]